jgi:hypothetical protein
VYRERLEDVALLRHPADADMGALVGAQHGDIGAVERDGAAEIAGDADHGIDQRGLAHAVAAQERQRLAFGKVQRHVRQHHGLAVAGRQILDAQKLTHRLPRRDRPL